MGLAMKKNITILVNSCDKYEDAWKPFFCLLHKYWSECIYDIILNTETKTYHHANLNIKTIPGGKLPWAKRLKNALLQIDTPYILYLLEDFFLTSKVSNDTFEMAHTLIEADNQIGYIGLKHNHSYTFRDNENIETQTLPFISKDDLICCNRVNSQSALWRRDWLLSLIKEHETPWEFEKYASIRSRRSNKKVLIINNNVCPPVFSYEVDFEYGYGIYGGKWLKNNETLFKEHGITVDFTNLGFYTQPTVSISKKKTFSIREYLYSLKHFLKIQKRKFVKQIRKYRSLH